MVPETLQIKQEDKEQYRTMGENVDSMNNHGATDFNNGSIQTDVNRIPCSETSPDTQHISGKDCEHFQYNFLDSFCIQIQISYLVLFVFYGLLTKER